VDDDRPYADLEREYQVESEHAINECHSLGYTPTVWISMLQQVGAAEAARRLLVSGDIQSGFSRLIQLGRPELTIEWSALNPRWEPLFAAQHREAAKWRLTQAGVPPRH
jgi:hypothetical protein